MGSHRSHWCRRIALLFGLLGVSPYPIRAEVVRFDQPISFHGGQLVGFERTAVARSHSREHSPKPGHVFVTLKLEFLSPFNYERGMFRELTLVDDSLRIYQYEGWLTDEGWVQMDDVNEAGAASPLAKLESSSGYPGYLNIHFQVPSSLQTLTLRFRDKTQPLLPHAAAATELKDFRLTPTLPVARSTPTSTVRDQNR